MNLGAKPADIPIQTAEEYLKDKKRYFLGACVYPEKDVFEALKLKEQDILRRVEDIAKEEIRNLKHEKNHPVNKALKVDTYNMELEIAEWEDFLNTFEAIKQSKTILKMIKK